ncbi:non-hydrolyzing UDP-N-acetylglucosamine 2-epimerase [Ferrovibrio sp.]|uniref:non-hydrolyzing UDP-N-acetylglucosamine 2-epimerase n=1 Tax=Ferrovibrio sp. TaxID=1917215 RepID=UPI0025BE9F26|nr:UDP-N-acetylglucosamine 2-epimerase (non-hydrolyzing) [Ferrovibrio sp.]
MMQNRTGKGITVVGARPQFIKAAAVSRAFQQQNGPEEILLHTGQHYDFQMSDVFFQELGIPAPKHHLGIHGGSHGAMTGRMLAEIERVLLDEKPDWVLVYGDTNSTLAAALAASKLHIPVVHVEAGLRSFNRAMPEEVNRVLADHVSELLFCPTGQAAENLRREGIERGVHVVGDVMYDTVLMTREAARRRSSILDKLGQKPGGYSIATVHREENTGDAAQLSTVIGYLREQAEQLPIILPLHPRTVAAAQRFGISMSGLQVIEPLGYLDMARLLDDCVIVYTDSGGLQKEAYFHRKPCVTLRNETEWVETVENGWNRLWRGPDYTVRRDIPDYGSGDAAARIVALLTESLA